MVEEVSDETIMCVDCRTDFVFTVKEILFYTSKGLTRTRRCAVCRRKKSAERKAQEATNGTFVVSASVQLVAPKTNLSPRERPRRKARRDSY